MTPARSIAEDHVIGAIDQSIERLLLGEGSREYVTSYCGPNGPGSSRVAIARMPGNSHVIRPVNVPRRVFVKPRCHP